MLQPQPELQHLSTAGSLQTQIAPLGTRCLLHVGQGCGEGGSELLALANQQHRGGFADAQELLRIQANRIGQLQTSHSPAVLITEPAHSTNGGVHVKPNAELAAERSKLGQGIDGPLDGAASHTHHRQHRPALLLG